MKTIFRGPEYNDSGVNVRPLFPYLRWLVIGVVALFGLLFLFNAIVKVTRIDAGYVGVEINLAGTQRGAADIPMRTGWVFYSPLRTQIIEFPTFVQTVDEGYPGGASHQRGNGLQLEGRHADLFGRIAFLCDRTREGA